ncbi:hypothetical protein B0T10DRAFT_596379 [Thelonectria olida]|uniref:Alpha/beta hydrolase fold-3 domain-containing protein n=1 Tax=Thelonectria olida TaxID=1576542 RepID=A0A9P8VRE5_9HYPO|nr:hypothetical protein B0T10DRAFT_596379 [Thelonectria olida]
MLLPHRRAPRLPTIKTGEELRIDLSGGVFIGGVSTGATLAAVTAQRWVTEKRQPAIFGVLRNTPMLLDKAIVPEKLKDLWFSREQNADAMVIDEKALDYIKTAYAPDVFSAQYSPFNMKMRTRDFLWYTSKFVGRIH